MFGGKRKKSKDKLEKSSKQAGGGLRRLFFGKPKTENKDEPVPASKENKPEKKPKEEKKGKKAGGIFGNLKKSKKTKESEPATLLEPNLRKVKTLKRKKKSKKPKKKSNQRKVKGMSQDKKGKQASQTQASSEVIKRDKNPQYPADVDFKKLQIEEEWTPNLGAQVGKFQFNNHVRILTVQAAV